MRQVYPYTALRDFEILALCLYREAEGESYLGKRAIAHVIVNRMDDSSAEWPHTIQGVILQHNAFSSFNIGNPRETVWFDDDNPIGQECIEIANNVIDGDDVDITEGALFYANLAQTPKFEWFDRTIVGHPETHPVTVVIGKHTFFK